jgi:hypothetical protein
MQQLDYVLKNDKEVLSFLKSRYPIYHLSNIFFRDVQYGIRTMFERRGEKIGYNGAEEIARAFVEKLEKEKIFNKIDGQSWAVNYPEFKTVARKVAAPAKPVPGSVAGAAKPASTRPPLPPLGSAKPVGASPAGTKPSLPPLTSAKPVGGAKPALPPLSSAKPVATTEAQTEEKVVEQAAQVVVEQPKAESKPATPSSSATPAAPPAGQRKPLPPLRGNYTPAGKK